MKLGFPNSLGVFLHKKHSSSSLFCGFEFLMAESTLTLQKLDNLIPISSQPAQGRLHCTDTKYQNQYHMQVYPQAVVHAPPYQRQNSHALGPPRWRGQRLHAIVDRPIPLTPSTNPRLGFGCQHQGLHRYARYGFLGPSSKTTFLTRILHHPFRTIISYFLC